MNLFLEKYENYKSAVNKRLANIIEETFVDSEVIKAMTYSLNIGGKRIRPVLILAFCECCGGLMSQALDIACAVEMVHTYSLIHDDLPCMDDDNLRRGQPACHIKFGQATALLAGDGLLTYAFNIISKAEINNDVKIEIIKNLSEAIGHKGMILGQDLDINTQQNLTLARLALIHSLKTGDLMRVCALIGSLVAGAKLNLQNVASQYGETIGLAYQIRDDIMDVVGTEKNLGKTVGIDKKNNKITFVDLLGVAKCKQTVENLSCEAKRLINSSMFKNCEFILKLTDYVLGLEI